MLQFPPPHYILYEPLNDVETEKAWTNYKDQYDTVCEFTEVDAAKLNTIDSFSPWFNTWIAQAPSKRTTQFRILLIYHSEFLTFSCQQMLRRSLENRSFKCRVWFHVEDPTGIQPAIISRSIVKRMPIYTHNPTIKQLCT
jgi:DNA polymerase III delta prime subunit